MKRTTVLLTDDLDRRLHEIARRTHVPLAEIVREALEQYLAAQTRPWPRSIGMGQNPDPDVTSANVKQWVRDQARRNPEHDTDSDVAASPC